MNITSYIYAEPYLGSVAPQAGPSAPTGEYILFFKLNFKNRIFSNPLDAGP